MRSLPFFVVAIALTGVNIWFQKHGKEIVLRDVTTADRVAGAGAVIWFYLSKALLPLDLIFIYPQWHFDSATARWWLPLAAGIAITAILLWQRNSRFGRPLLFAWAFFCVSLLPVLGFTDVGFMKYSLVADHYQYIALIAVVALAAAGWSLWQRGLEESKQWLAWIPAGVVVIALTWLTNRQSTLYDDPVVLYLTTLKSTPDCSIAHNNVGYELHERGEFKQAKEHFEEAIRLNPKYADAHNNLANVLAEEGRNEEAIAQCQMAIQVDPDLAEPYNNMGLSLAHMGRHQEAISVYHQALNRKYFFPEAHCNLGLSLVRVGQTLEGLKELGIALDYDPKFPDAWGGATIAYMQLGQKDQALAAAEKAVVYARERKRDQLAAEMEKWLRDQGVQVTNQPGQALEPDANSAAK